MPASIDSPPTRYSIIMTGSRRTIRRASNGICNSFSGTDMIAKFGLRSTFRSLGYSAGINRKNVEDFTEIWQDEYSV